MDVHRYRRGEPEGLSHNGFMQSESFRWIIQAEEKQPDKSNVEKKTNKHTRAPEPTHTQSRTQFGPTQTRSHVQKWVARFFADYRKACGFDTD